MTSFLKLSSMRQVIRGEHAAYCTDPNAAGSQPIIEMPLRVTAEVSESVRVNVGLWE